MEEGQGRNLPPGGSKGLVAGEHRDSEAAPPEVVWRGGQGLGVPRSVGYGPALEQGTVVKVLERLQREEAAGRLPPEP